MWFWLSITSALLGAVGNIFNKKALKDVDAVVFTWSIFALSLPLLGFIAFKDGLPHVHNLFFYSAIGAALVFAVSKAISNTSIKNGTLSKLIPLASMNILFTYLLGLIFLHETVSVEGILGLLLILIGVYILNAEGAKEDLLKPFRILLSDRTSLFYILAILLISIETIFIKTAIKNTFSNNVALVAFTEQAIMTILLTGFLIKKKIHWSHEVKTNFWVLLINSLFYAGVSLLSFQAFATASVVLASGVKQSQLLFTLLFGILFLNDHPTKHTWVASFFMIIGVILIKIYS